MVVIEDDSGNKVPTADKSCVFFRNGWYYLSWGNNYAMSRKLKGPYRYIGKFPTGGHASVFEFKGKWYAIQEKSETNIFYRGTQIRVLSFNQDGTIILSQEENDSSHVKAYNFKYSTQGWSGETGTEVKRDCPCNIYGHTTAKNAIISSTKFLHFRVTDDSKLKIRLKNVSKSKTIKVAVCSYNFDKGFFKLAPKYVDWNTQEWIEKELLLRDDLYQEVTINLNEFKTIGKFVHQIAIMPVPDITDAEWQIESVTIN